MKTLLGMRKFDVLVALYVFGIMVAELMGAKTFPVASIGSFHLTASVAIFVMPLLFTSVDVIVEVYGKQRARSIVRTGLLIVLLQVITAAIFTKLTPSSFYASSQSAYATIFGTSIRFGLASVLAFAASELLDVAIFAKLRQRMQRKGLWLRNNVANFLSQLVDSTVWTTLAFYTFGLSIGANASFLLGIIVPYYLVRIAMSVVETPLVYLGVRWLRPAKKSPETDTPLTLLEAEA
jgi:uncharacterized integral membrane protein (TIGR00697 family)